MSVCFLIQYVHNILQYDNHNIRSYILENKHGTYIFNDLDLPENCINVRIIVSRRELSNHIHSFLWFQDRTEDAELDWTIIPDQNELD